MQGKCQPVCTVLRRYVQSERGEWKSIGTLVKGFKRGHVLREVSFYFFPLHGDGWPRRGTQRGRRALPCHRRCVECGQWRRAALHLNDVSTNLLVCCQNDSYVRSGTHFISSWLPTVTNQTERFLSEAYRKLKFSVNSVCCTMYGLTKFSVAVSDSVGYFAFCAATYARLLP